FVEVFPGTEGLVHISNLAEGRVEKVTDVCKEGDIVTVKATGVDRRGKIQLSIKDV
ncbi:MAG: S1 RNA-binding domain-containing protein, partial [SAR324 cluster bacterium]|nr:S1 RNA-binding domain-containing protein [SAR324 cluster bacterium]